MDIYIMCQEKLDFINSFSTELGMKYKFDIVYQKIWDEYKYGLIRKLYNPVVVFASTDICEFDSMLHAFIQALKICAFSCLD